MATFTFSKTTGATGTQGFIGSAYTDGGTFDINKLWDQNEYDDLTGSASQVKFYDYDGKSFFELKGSGFTYIGETPIAGNVTTINLKEAGFMQAAVTGLTGINLAMLYTLSGSGVFGNGDSMLFMAELMKGNDTVKLTALDDVLVEGWNAGNDSIFGYAGNDTLFGDDGNDTLDGGTGNDSMSGGKGDDTYIVDSLLDSVHESPTADGTDLVKSSVSFSLNAADGPQSEGAVENLTLTGTLNINGFGNALANKITGNAKNNVILGGGGGDTLDGGAGIDTVSYAGSAAGVTVTLGGKTPTNPTGGDAAGDSIVNFENITGSDHADVLIGDAGKNVLDGGAGDDGMSGGKGDDSYVVDSATDVVTEQFNEGKDTVIAKLSFSIEALLNVENLTLAEEAFDSIATGNSAKNTVTGNSYDNTLDGRGGGDVLIGGDGDDHYKIYGKTDKVTELAGQGEDEIIVASTFAPDSKGVVTYSIAAIKNVENLSYQGTMKFVGTGNALANDLNGGTADDKLSGGDGNDRLTGGQGKDVLTGGKHNDTFVFDDLGGQMDIVVDFAAGDLLDIGAFIQADAPGMSFVDLVNGGYLIISTGAFSTGQSTDSTTLSNTVLAWDADGSAGNAATVQNIVTLEDYATALTDANFINFAQ